MPNVSEIDDVCGIWVQGLSGCGKTTYVTKRWPKSYLKPINKWWDGYTTEAEVLLDDLDKTHASWVGYFLKKWSDKFPFIAEQKGTSIKIRPQVFIVTSQYTIDQIFEDEESRQALKRRFKIHDFFSPLEASIYRNWSNEPIVPLELTEDEMLLFES
jgi:hypothetical protein